MDHFSNYSMFISRLGGGGDSSASPSPQRGSEARSYLGEHLGICIRRPGVGVVLLDQANVGLLDLLRARVLPHLQQLKSLMQLRGGWVASPSQHTSGGLEAKQRGRQTPQSMLDAFSRQNGCYCRRYSEA